MASKKPLRITRKKSSGIFRAISSRERIIRGLPDLRQVLRGSLVTRYRRCGVKTCHCAAEGDRGHGPAYYLMVTVGPGNTLQVYVPEECKEQVEDWIENFRRVRQTLEDISTLNRELLRQGKLFRGG
jgi:hypothetical protein